MLYRNYTFCASGDVFILPCDITWLHDQRDTGLAKLESLNLFATELSFVLIGIMELKMTFLICRCGHMFWTCGLVSGIPSIKITTVQSLIVNSWKSRRSAVIAFYFVTWHSLTTRSKFNTLSQHPTKCGGCRSCVNRDIGIILIFSCDPRRKYCLRLMPIHFSH